MVELLRDQGGARHEAESRVEVLEGEGAGDGVTALHLAPAREFRERRLARRAGQFLGHDYCPVLVIGRCTMDFAMDIHCHKAVAPKSAICQGLAPSSATSLQRRHS